jgi:hypothetical protein
MSPRPGVCFLEAGGESLTGNEVLQHIRSVMIAALHQTAEPVAVKILRGEEQIGSVTQDI